ncbi:MAG TPA: DNA-directed RNA polymerase subunit beta', partial [Mycobacteriales bacterium]|nr:DNA-directed RNA polymerase subunit beta' [Mycobacteriales bacterium]
ADDIRLWSHGEVKKPETINYRTLKPEKDGLFCEKIFGPTRDWECYCGKYKRVRFKGIICERCGVEVTRAKVRRERMGHIELAAPVTHIWYFKGVPSRLGYLLDLAPKDLEKIIYFAGYLVTEVDADARHRDLASIEAQFSVEKSRITDKMNADIDARMKRQEADIAQLEAEGAKADARRKVRDSADREVKQIRTRAERSIDELDAVLDAFKSLAVKQLITDERVFRELRDRFAKGSKAEDGTWRVVPGTMGEYFEAGMGAESLKKLLKTFDLDAEAESLRETIRTGKGQKKARALKRLKVVSAFLNTRNSPMGMVLDCVPVIPPDLRPMVQLDGGRFATSDLNDLYRRVINRNNRLKRLLDLGAPEIIVNNEKRMLQEAVDALFDNGRRGRPVTGPGNRPLKSLSDMLKGKQGRFRQNLLGKRVDYSGRSVIVVGPQLRLHQCGLPKQMALELFKPFVMKRLVDLNHAQNIKSAKRMVERATGSNARYSMVWDVLEEVITEHPVLLNRAPTLHRLGIQAFEPQLVEGKAIQIHPLVCTAFNADFDGDQMAVHLPLSAEAQAEARILMLSSNNILSPAHGRPITSPTQDMVLGLYYLTLMREDQAGQDRTFASVSEAIMAYDTGELNLQARIKIRLDDLPASREDAGVPAVQRGADASERPFTGPEGWEVGQPVLLETTLGRALFNEALPLDYPFIDHEVRKAQLGEIVNDLAERYPKVQVAATLDALKEAGFHWATRAGVTISISDVVTPPEKQAIVGRYEEQAEKVQKQYERGVITDDERRQELIEIWTRATTEVAQKMRENFPKDNPIQMMVGSGARGNMLQVQQIAGMRGLVANPKGEIIPRPIKANFREGLTVLEYFISTHGARKGLADTALRTADSGYLTRRLVDVSQDVIVREEDCGTERGIVVPIAVETENGIALDRDNIETRVYTRTLAEDVVVDKKVLAKAGADLGDVLIGELVDQGVTEVRVRSVLTCDSKVGICGLCYGRSLATGKTVDVGEAVGIIAAQSIGEPGTQLTMRTFHTGGVAGEDITHGLPRVVELFEARQPKGRAPISEVAGRVSIQETDKTAMFVITPDDGGEPVEYPLSKRMLSWRWYATESERARGQWRVEEGQHVEVGDQLHAGAVDPHEVLRILGPRAVQLHLVKEVQEVYRSQGVTIHDKHIEIIIRQMLKRVNILESGDTELLPGELAERPKFEEENQRVVAEGGTPAAGRPVLMGITKASLATESWLSAASFQETTRVLTDAAIHARSDSLLGLKENVIIGKLIPAGTGISRYRNVRVEPTEEAKAAVYTMMPYDDAGYDFGQGSGEAVPLEDFSFGQRPGYGGNDYGSYR